MKLAAPLQRAAKRLRDHALGFPEATEDFPWGHTAIKVKGKMFLVLSDDEGELSLSVKLPTSNLAALMFPFASPTRYGMGKSGWVTARFGANEKPPVELLVEWVGESYRAVAPKSIVKALDGGAPPRKAKRR